MASDGEENTNGHTIGPVKADNDTKQEDAFVVIDANGELTELPTEDNILTMATLQAAVPGATGLKFKNPKTGASRAVMVDPTGAKLLAPADGWEDKVFTVIVPPSARHERGADVSVKRRKGASDGESDSDGEGRVGRKRAADHAEVEPVERRPVDLIVLGVNYKTTDEGFKAHFESFGPVVFGEVKRNPDGTSKGFGFVQMATIEDQDRVVAVQTHMIDGRRCEAKVPDQRFDTGISAYTGGQRSLGSKVPISKIFVGRLTEKHDEECLRTFFGKEATKVSPDATVNDVFIPRPFRGFAFVNFSAPEVAERLVKQNNFVIEGSSISVTLAVPREELSQPSAGAYFNEYGYGYGYGKGGAGYGGAAAAYAGQMKDYQQSMYGGYGAHSGGYGRGGYDSTGWVAPPSAAASQAAAAAAAVGSTARLPRDQWAAAYPTRGAKQAYQPSGGPQGGYGGGGKDMPAQTVSNQIARGLDALDLNQMNPEHVSVAWSLFVNSLNASSSGGQPPQQHWTQ